MTRIDGYDLARSLAIFGMVVVNFKTVMAIHSSGLESEFGTDWLLFLTGLIEGRAAAVFVVLAGVGLTLGSRRAIATRDPALIAIARLVLWKRAAALYCGGLLFAVAWPADILHFYGLYIAIGALLITARNRTLLGLAALLVAAFFVMLLTLNYEAGWDFDTLHYEDFWTLEGQVRHLFFNGFHPVVPWLAFLVLGIWLGRRDLLARAVRRRVVIGGAVVAGLTEAVSATLIGLLARGASTDESQVITALFGTEAMPPGPFYMLAAGGTAIAVIALSVEFSQRYSRLPGYRPVLAAGRLALTIYVAHVLLGLGVLEAIGFLEGQTLPFAVATSVGFYALAVTGAGLWTKRFERGPLEWLMRKIVAVPTRR